jgi:putative ABC transport system permease protein
VVNAWYIGVEGSSANRLITRNAISLIFTLPVSYQNKIKQIPGITGISYGNWFGGVYIDEKNFFPQFAIDSRTFFDLYPEFVIPPEQKAVFLRERNACIAGVKLCARYGWKIGDVIPIRGTIYPGNWEFVLQGIYRGAKESTDETQFFFHWEYLNETLKQISPRDADHVGWYIIRVAEPDQAPQIARAIDQTFKNSLAETFTETEKAFQMGFIAMTEVIVIAIQIISLVVIIIIMIVLANTMIMIARERLWEYAVLKTLGFGTRHLVTLIAGESLTIALLGAGLGIFLAFPAANAFGKAMGVFFPVFHISLGAILASIAASIVVGVVAAIFPAWRAVRVKISEGLSRIA